MSFITNTQLLNIADNVAKSLVDIETDFISNPGANSPTVSTITSGQTGSSNSLAARALALSPAGAYSWVQAKAPAVAAALAGYVSVPKTTLYALYAPLMVALDADVGNLADYLNANALQVHPEFAACFNYVAQNALNKGWAGYQMAPIMPPCIFPASEVTLGSIAVTGTAAGTFTAGTAIDVSQFAPQALFLKNTAGSGTTGTATSFTVTYTNAAGQSGQTATQALSGSLGAGAYLAIGSIVGQAVSNIVVNSGGANGDAIAVVAKVLRAVAY